MSSSLVGCLCMALDILENRSRYTPVLLFWPSGRSSAPVVGLGKRVPEEVGFVDRPRPLGGPDAHVPDVGPSLQQEREVAGGYGLQSLALFGQVGPLADDGRLPAPGDLLDGGGPALGHDVVAVFVQPRTPLPRTLVNTPRRSAVCAPV